MNELTSCPWSGFQQSQFPICEATLCSWVRQPGNTVSNIGFIAVGLFLLWRYRKKHHEMDQGIGLCALFMGICSTVAHSSGIVATGFLDFASIFSLGSLFIVKNLKAEGVIRPQNQRAVFLGVYFACIVTLYFLGIFKPILVLLFVLILLAWEFRILKSQDLKEFIQTTYKLLITFLIGAISIGLDMGRFVCDPDNHYFQMHMIWHFAMALNIFFLAEHALVSRPSNSNEAEIVL